MQTHSEYDRPPHASRPAPQKRRRRRRLKKHYRILLRVLAVLAVCGILYGLFSLFSFLIGHFDFSADHDDQAGELDASISQSDPAPGVTMPEIIGTPELPKPTYSTLTTTEDTVQIDTTVTSEYAVLAELNTGNIVAAKNAEAKIYPASMTKILTLLVAMENITDTSGTYTMNIEITDYCFVNDCSVVGYMLDEKIPIEELFYGCILSSGADACLALADLAAGSHEAFVDLMNAKLKELGLSETSHFTNCVGIHNKEHYSTVQDMAIMLKAALENERCREVLSTAVYNSAPTEHHPEGQVLSNWFLRRIEDKDTGDITVCSAKTGYVLESGNCAASYGEDSNGKGYLCVTGKASSNWQAIYDHVALYEKYCYPVI